MRKTVGFRKIMKDYAIGLKLLFSEPKAYLVIMAFIGRTFTSSLKDLYLAVYFKTWYSDKYTEFVEQAALSSLICVPLFSVLQTILIEVINKRTNATVPIILVFKFIFDVVSNYFIFYQQGNFMLAVLGLYLDFSLTKGQPGLLVITLATVVDERAANFVVVIIILFQKAMVNLITYIMAHLNSGSEKLAHGPTIFYLGSIPEIVSIMCIVVIGFKMKALFEIDENKEDASQIKMKKMKLQRLKTTVNFLVKNDFDSYS